jgi:hypothetical protein
MNKNWRIRLQKWAQKPRKRQDRFDMDAIDNQEITDYLLR